MQSHVPAAAHLASDLMAAGIGLGRGLLCTLLILIGSLSTYFSEGPAELKSDLPIVLASLNVPELEHSGVWSLRSKQEHAGCVAIMKLARDASGAVLAASHFETLLTTLHSAARLTPNTFSGLSSRSSELVLNAAADLISSVAKSVSPGQFLSFDRPLSLIIRRNSAEKPNENRNSEGKSLEPWVQKGLLKNALEFKEFGDTDWDKLS